MSYNGIDFGGRRSMRGNEGRGRNDEQSIDLIEKCAACDEPPKDKVLKWTKCKFEPFCKQCLDFDLVSQLYDAADQLVATLEYFVARNLRCAQIAVEFRDRFDELQLVGDHETLMNGHEKFINEVTQKIIEVAKLAVIKEVKE